MNTANKTVELYHHKNKAENYLSYLKTTHNSLVAPKDCAYQ